MKYTKYIYMQNKKICLNKFHIFVGEKMFQIMNDLITNLDVLK